MNFEKIDNGKKMPRVWHAQHEVILKLWGENASCYRYMHNKAYLMYKTMNMRMTLPIIIISTVTGTANFAQETFPVAWRAWVPAAIGTLNLFAAILTTILQFLKVSELMESHRVSSIHYGKLSRSIRLDLTLPITERVHNGGPMVDICRGEYDRLIEQSPPLPKKIVNQFDKKFPETDSKYQFSRPEILTLHGINTYDNDKEKRLTDTVVNAFRERVANSNTSPRDKQHRELINELNELKTQAIVSSKNASLASVEVISDEPLKLQEGESSIDVSQANTI